MKLKLKQILFLFLILCISPSTVAAETVTWQIIDPIIVQPNSTEDIGYIEIDNMGAEYAGNITNLTVTISETVNLDVTIAPDLTTVTIQNENRKIYIDISVLNVQAQSETLDLNFSYTANGETITHNQTLFVTIPTTDKFWIESNISNTVIINTGEADIISWIKIYNTGNTDMIISINDTCPEYIYIPPTVQVPYQTDSMIYVQYSVPNFIFEDTSCNITFNSDTMKQSTAFNVSIQDIIAPTIIQYIFNDTEATQPNTFYVTVTDNVNVTTVQALILNQTYNLTRVLNTFPTQFQLDFHGIDTVKLYDVNITARDTADNIDMIMTTLKIIRLDALQYNGLLEISKQRIKMYSTTNFFEVTKNTTLNFELQDLFYVGDSIYDSTVNSSDNTTLNIQSNWIFELLTPTETSHIITKVHDTIQLSDIGQYQLKFKGLDIGQYSGTFQIMVGSERNQIKFNIDVVEETVPVKTYSKTLFDNVVMTCNLKDDGNMMNAVQKCCTEYPYPYLNPEEYTICSSPEQIEKTEMIYLRNNEALQAQKDILEMHRIILFGLVVIVSCYAVYTNSEASKILFMYD